MCRFQASLSQINIGKKVMFGPKVSIHAGNHRTDLVGKYMIDIGLNEKLHVNDEDVVIEDDVWVGTNSVILKGSHIGEGSIIGAGCIISGTMPPFTIVLGNNLRKTKPRFTIEEIQKHKNRLSMMKNTKK